MTRIARSWLVLVAVAAAAGAATPADQQFQFAQKLAGTREAAFAVLEYRRFIHLFPQDRRVPDARYAIARSYLRDAGDLAAAQRELGLLVRHHPQSPAARRAVQLIALIDANKQDDHQPLLLFFGAVSARDRGDAAAALAKLDQLIARYPRAPLVPEALLLRAKLLESLTRLDDAIAAYAEVPARAPNSSLVPRALLGQATATEARDGAQPYVAVLYRQVIARYPRTPEAAEARKRLATLDQHLDNLPRRFARRDIQPFRVLRHGYLDKRDRYDVRIEVARNLTEDQIEATLEDALIKHAGDRKGRDHEVRIEAYPAGSRTRVGKATWARNRRPEYEVDVGDARTQDLWRDILKDVLK